MIARVLAAIAAVLLASAASCPAVASDACSTIAVRTRAEVRVSDGLRYVMESFYSAPAVVALRRTQADSVSVVAMEGPLAWSAAEETELGGGFERSFALGHQFHALLLHFDEIVPGARETETTHAGEVRRALVGDWPHGGEVELVMNRANTRAELINLRFPDTAQISVAFRDWRRTGGASLPRRAIIDDGSRTFDYRFTAIETAPRAPGWFAGEIAAPDLDAVRIYRLHRQILAAHCAGDAPAIAALAAPETLDVSGAGVTPLTRAQIGERFARTFIRRDYSAYHDTATPVIEVSADGEAGWIAAQVRAIGVVNETGAPFDEQWAWLMPVLEIDGAWRFAGIAASRVE